MSQCIDEITKEFNHRNENNTYSVYPQYTLILHGLHIVFIFRKRNLLTGEVKKYKSRLHVDGSRMKEGVDST